MLLYCNFDPPQQHSAMSHDFAGPVAACKKHTISGAAIDAYRTTHGLAAGQCATWLRHFPHVRFFVDRPEGRAPPPACRRLNATLERCCGANSTPGDSLARAQYKREHTHAALHASACAKIHACSDAKLALHAA